MPAADPERESIGGAESLLPAQPAAIWVLAGAPGAGKSTVATLLLAAWRAAGDPVPALLDKDTLYSGFVDAVLETAGRPRGEREGDWYDAHIKRHEYGGMTAAAREISGHGCPVVLCGPFTGQIRDKSRWHEWVQELGGGRVLMIYVRSDANTLASRLGSRGSERDGGKRRDLAAFVARMSPDVPPPLPHAEIDNRAGAQPLAQQVQALSRDWNAEGEPRHDSARVNHHSGLTP